jgi:hypothetical protein
LGHARGIRPYPNARVWSVVAVSGNCRIQDLTCGLRAIKISRCTLSFSDYLIYCLLRKKTNPILWPPQRAYDHVCPKVRIKVILLKAFDFMNHYSIFSSSVLLAAGAIIIASMCVFAHACVCYTLFYCLKKVMQTMCVFAHECVCYTLFYCLKKVMESLRTSFHILVHRR